MPQPSDPPDLDQDQEHDPSDPPPMDLKWVAYGMAGVGVLIAFNACLKSVPVMEGGTVAMELRWVQEPTALLFVGLALVFAGLLVLVASYLRMSLWLAGYGPAARRWHAAQERLEARQEAEASERMRAEVHEERRRREQARIEREQAERDRLAEKEAAQAREAERKARARQALVESGELSAQERAALEQADPGPDGGPDEGPDHGPAAPAKP